MTAVEIYQQAGVLVRNNTTTVSDITEFLGQHGRRYPQLKDRLLNKYCASASRQHDVEIIEYLLAAGANPNCGTGWNQVLSSLCDVGSVRSRSGEKLVRIAGLLLDHGAGASGAPGPFHVLLMAASNPWTPAERTLMDYLCSRGARPCADIIRSPKYGKTGDHSMLYDICFNVESLRILQKMGFGAKPTGGAENRATEHCSGAPYIFNSSEIIECLSLACRFAVRDTYDFFAGPASQQLLLLAAGYGLSSEASNDAAAMHIIDDLIRVRKVPVDSTGRGECRCESRSSGAVGGTTGGDRTALWHALKAGHTEVARHLMDVHDAEVTIEMISMSRELQSYMLAKMNCAPVAPIRAAPVLTPHELATAAAASATLPVRPAKHDPKYAAKYAKIYAFTYATVYATEFAKASLRNPTGRGCPTSQTNQDDDVSFYG